MRSHPRAAALAAGVLFALLLAACFGAGSQAPQPELPAPQDQPIAAEPIEVEPAKLLTPEAEPVDLPEPDCPIVVPIVEQPEGTPQPDPQPDRIGGYVGMGLVTTGCTWALGSMPAAFVTVTLEGAGPDGDFGSIADNVSYTAITDDNGCFVFDAAGDWPWRLLAPATIGSRSIQCDSDDGSPVGTVDVVVSGTPPTSKDNHFGY